MRGNIPYGDYFAGRFCRNESSALLSGSPALDNNCSGHNIVHSPVVLEEEQGDEDGEEEGDGEVLVQGSYSRAEEGHGKQHT